MGQRLDLQALFVSMIGAADRVYFQPPPTLTMQYPCIVYELDDFDVRHANDNPYTVQRSYSVTYIDPNPDNSMVDELIRLPLCGFDRHFVTDNNHHYVYNIFF